MAVQRVNMAPLVAASTRPQLTESRTRSLALSQSLGKGGEQARARARLRTSGPAALTLLLLVLAGCRRQHIAVSSVPELGYPQCQGRLPPEHGDVLAAGHLRSGVNAQQHSIVERFSFERRDCVVVGTFRQEWPLGIADVEIVYGPDWTPLRAWRRTTIPGVRRSDGQADIRRYELRTAEITVKHRNASGAVNYEILRGGHPTVVVASGRGMLTAWLRHAHLNAGERVRETVLDIREILEVIREATLERDPDEYLPFLGRTVRVYTFFGHETVYADDHDTVIGDLSGLQPSETVHDPAPAPMPMYGVPDPIRTP